MSPAGGSEKVDSRSVSVTATNGGHGALKISGLKSAHVGEVPVADLEWLQVCRDGLAL